MAKKYRDRSEKKSKFLTTRKIPEDYDKKRPIFSLEHLLKDYCLSKCEKEEKVSFADKFVALSQLTWGQIKQSHRHGLGSEKIDQKSLHFKLPDHITEDCTILAMRFHRKAPMIGYRINEIFYILCFDRGFIAYNHGS